MSSHIHVRHEIAIFEQNKSYNLPEYAVNRFPRLITGVSRNLSLGFDEQYCTIA